MLKEFAEEIKQTFEEKKLEKKYFVENIIKNMLKKYNLNFEKVKQKML